jgi:AcrR family transcriptional regulator
MVVQLSKSRSDERRDAILDVAGEIFLQEGFAAASMSAIAARLGGSKGTLYNYFTSKTELFAAFMARACLANSEALVMATSNDEAPVAEALQRIGCGFIEFILREDSMAVQRLVIAEAQRFPELGEAFFEAGPKLSNEKLADWMKRRIDRGELRAVDPRIAARQFFALCKSGPQTMRMWNVIPEVSREQIEGHVAEQVKMFMAAYGVRPHE